MGHHLSAYPPLISLAEGIFDPARTCLQFGTQEFDQQLHGFVNEQNDSTCMFHTLLACKHTAECECVGTVNHVCKTKLSQILGPMLDLPPQTIGSSPYS